MTDKQDRALQQAKTFIEHGHDGPAPDPQLLSECLVEAKDRAEKSEAESEKYLGKLRRIEKYLTEYQDRHLEKEPGEEVPMYQGECEWVIVEDVISMAYISKYEKPTEDRDRNTDRDNLLEACRLFLLMGYGRENEDCPNCERTVSKCEVDMGLAYGPCVGVSIRKLLDKMEES